MNPVIQLRLYLAFSTTQHCYVTLFLQICNSLTSLLAIKMYAEVAGVSTNTTRLQLVPQIYVKGSELGTENLKMRLN